MHSNDANYIIFYVRLGGCLMRIVYSRPFLSGHILLSGKKGVGWTKEKSWERRRRKEENIQRSGSERNEHEPFLSPFRKREAPRVCTRAMEGIGLYSRLLETLRKHAIFRTPRRSFCCPFLFHIILSSASSSSSSSLGCINIQRSEVYYSRVDHENE